MLNRDGIRTQSYANNKQILANVNLQASISGRISAAVSETVNGRKIIKAGTPLVGNTLESQTPYTVFATGTDTTITGVLLHDVDVTDVTTPATGAVNGTVLIFGVINLRRMDATVQAKYTPEVVELLAANMIRVIAAN